MNLPDNISYRLELEIEGIGRKRLMQLLKRALSKGKSEISLNTIFFTIDKNGPRLTISDDLQEFEDYSCLLRSFLDYLER